MDLFKKIKNLNEFIKILENEKKSRKIKIILSSSINNTDIKYAFIDNLKKIIGIKENNNFINEISGQMEVESKLFLDSYDFYSNKKELFSEIDENLDFDQENKEICEYYEKFIEKEHDEIMNKFYDENNAIIDNKVSSICILDRLYSNKTEKLYCSNLVTGKSYIEKYNLDENEKCLIRQFNYNLK